MTVIAFDPPPTALPERFASPFDPGPPSPLARRAADQLLAELRAGTLAGVDVAALDEPGGGKMFGVLVVADGAGRVGTLRAFSGMLGGRWHVDGFAPPLFDPERRDAFWPAAEAELDALLVEHEALTAAAAPVRAELDARVADHAAAVAAMRDRHQGRKAERAIRRAALDAAVPGVAPGAIDDGDRARTRHAIDQESRADGAERKRLDADHRAAHALLAARLAELDQRRAALERHRGQRSRQFWQQILDGYTIVSGRGEQRPLTALFAPEVPPGGAGDCAAPKLLGQAYRDGLRPLALAEVWWGATPATGGRHAGHFYPACRGKCGPILAHMLDGLPADPAPLFGAGAIADHEPRPVHGDRWLVVVDKPVGLLSVPGRHAQLRDSVQVRLRRRHPDASGPLVVHRLDLDTSGLLIAALDDDTHAALQRLFARREVDKRYIAWLAGDVAGDRGTIELPLRVDLDDRPRQIVDPVHGKTAVTDWEVVDRRGGRTRVALFPRTGRSHQLRVHAAHRDGLGAPIVGDRLYGAATGDRLLLHAEQVGFVHPHTGNRVVFTSPAPF